MKKIPLLFASIFTLPAAVMANPDVTTREYKLLLNPALFTSATESTKVADYFASFTGAVESAIARDVSGSLTLDKTRTVKFYDTAGSCLLDDLGYIFRDRIENGQSEVTLKFRSPDSYIADFEDLSASSNQAKTKLEADIGSKSGTAFNIVYGHSTTSPNTRTINNFEDINVHFPGFDTNYGIADSTTLSLVGNLSIYERVYDGGIIDLGSIDAEVSVTLWYSSVPSGSQKPVVVEVSFKYEDPSADYTKAVVNRAKQSFDAIQTLSSWNSTSSVTKTQFIYQYNPTFCN
ncbi:hypothetical protein [Cellvibrio mixtus]|uniref:hypothetical protein n=1 Tax=Cellvibrio mixtus TaxID=39650 RepID=UPI0005871C07|nr:hypothetical protein [Cellvibrio mixtus]